tara:strand:- start:116 stop:313 length:198 start_codon:yes stop_codon:yes gene_type:complete
MKMTVTTEDGGRQNMFAKEPQIAVMEGETSYIEAAEKANGRWAMIGIFAALATYAYTGQIIPGIW